MYQMNYNNSAKQVNKLIQDLNRFCFDSKNILKLDLLSNKENNYTKKKQSKTKKH